MKNLLLAILIVSFFDGISQKNCLDDFEIDPSGNILTGLCAGASITSGTDNVFMGGDAGQNSTTAKRNILIGNGSGKFGISVFDNTFIGTSTGRFNTASGNTFIGSLSGEINTTGVHNVFIGFKTGNKNITGSSNTFVGHLSGSSNTGGGNSFFGSNAGLVNTSGELNAFFGFNAGLRNTVGSGNSFFGGESGKDNTTGAENTFVGHHSGVNNRDGDANVFVGNLTGNKNLSGNENTFLGQRAGFSNTEGNKNTFVGTLAGINNVAGGHNTFLGSQAGVKNQAEFNTYVGADAGFNASRGSGNVYLGIRTGQDNEEGSNNTFTGARAGGNSKGSNGVFLGHLAGFNETESNKLHIANSVKNTLIYGDFRKKHVAIGGIPSVSDQDKYALYVFGDAHATGVWQSSDARYKKNEKQVNDALGKIQKVKGFSYEFKSAQESAVSGLPFHFPEGKQIGFLAQELKEVFPELVKEDNDGYMSVNYSGMVPVLLEAIKELDAKITAQNETIAELNASSVTDSRFTTPLQLSNYPNPAKGETTIEYDLGSSNEQAQIIIFDLQGKQLKVIDQLIHRGEISISTNELGTGLFHYALVVDGQIRVSKKMILQ